MNLDIHTTIEDSQNKLHLKRLDRGQDNQSVIHDELYKTCSINVLGYKKMTTLLHIRISKRPNVRLIFLE